MADKTAEVVIKVDGLRKTFVRMTRMGPARRTALSDVSFEVHAGEIHGFLGPNGAGKTTTLRILTGLARKDAGRVTLFGREVPAHLPQVMARIGAMIEAPR